MRDEPHARHHGKSSCPHSLERSRASLRFFLLHSTRISASSSQKGQPARADTRYGCLSGCRYRQESTVGPWEGREGQAQGAGPGAQCSRAHAVCNLTCPGALTSLLTSHKQQRQHYPNPAHPHVACPRSRYIKRGSESVLAFSSAVHCIHSRGPCADRPVLARRLSYHHYSQPKPTSSSKHTQASSRLISVASFASIPLLQSC